ncbi:MAG TPA: carboxymuconolactone decarboxylase family protein [Cyclobacteriaceae bacterium]|nr:carboxymuconolactone decarboxylase family protein [Cyclobacteriaceae bacterium]
MNARMSIKHIEPKVYDAMGAAEKIIQGFDIDPKLRELIKVRVSQINGCGYCINMHTRDARKLGETEQRLYALSAWWEVPFFSDEEQAALKLAEEVTMISAHGVTDETFAKAILHFGEQKVAQLILIIMTINSWNRIAISTHMIAV